ncbi:MAG: hypothetical protein E1N59_2056 [Puniceicoccaceae bacterium 5H]|nr:MAG: hypothetical protein E1N59_2056 [Puniceicoccaceae bacterium 5H]
MAALREIDETGLLPWEGDFNPLEGFNAFPSPPKHESIWTGKWQECRKSLMDLAGKAGVEPATYALEERCSIL